MTGHRLTRVTKLKPKEQARSVQAHLTAGAKTLSRLRHPSLLRVIEVLPDSNSHIAVITEPVFASLANALKRYDGPAFAPPDVAKSSSDAVRVAQTRDGDIIKAGPFTSSC